MTRNQFDSNVTWVRIPPSAPKAAPCGRCFLFLRQTMQGLQGGIRTARARRFASRRAKMPRWGIFRARESPRVCAKSSTLRGAVFYFCGKLCKGAGESHRLCQVSLLSSTLGSDFFIASLQNSVRSIYCFRCILVQMIPTI